MPENNAQEEEGAVLELADLADEREDYEDLENVDNEGVMYSDDDVSPTLDDLVDTTRPSTFGAAADFPQPPRAASQRGRVMAPPFAVDTQLYPSSLVGVGGREELLDLSTTSLTRFPPPRSVEQNVW
eukprot:CAMPEP_0113845094 /NCGR_PEP_ID=MMETSP0372-20130328/574_1 /TAXON_ID=340204 /ORGANISM="Lankesteria abbotti" /LENGTH=126 /DNA_ID=CAMNT_0000814115 /DNA_START=485 /DNA_END=862 /DNA_ORIENTATION=- /assembly_acc=CAM_ASM_000359